MGGSEDRIHVISELRADSDDCGVERRAFKIWSRPCVSVTEIRLRRVSSAPCRLRGSVPLGRSYDTRDVVRKA